jgi:hypothetical protein
MSEHPRVIFVRKCRRAARREDRVGPLAARREELAKRPHWKVPTLEEDALRRALNHARKKGLKTWQKGGTTWEHADA